MRKGKDTTASSKTCHGLCIVSQRVTRRSKCALIVKVSIFTARKHWTATSRNTTHISSMVMCERCLNVFDTLEKFEQHKTLCVVKDSNTRPVIFPSPGREVKWCSESDFKLNDVPTYLVADLSWSVSSQNWMRRKEHTLGTSTNTSPVPL